MVLQTKGKFNHDVFSKTKRSEVMSLIRGSGNKKTELALVALFRKNRITGWRRNVRLYGKPDFVFRKDNLIIFVDGCFWHWCPNHCKLPSNNRSFWKNKLQSNRVRDRAVTRKLRKDGFKILRIWEHELTARNEMRLLKRLSKFINW